MTLDDLINIYDDAYNDAFDPLAYHLDEEDMEASRKAMRSIVDVLRDSIVRSLAEVAREECCGVGSASDKYECCCCPDLIITTDQVDKAFNDILKVVGEP